MHWRRAYEVRIASLHAQLTQPDRRDGRGVLSRPPDRKPDHLLSLHGDDFPARCLPWSDLTDLHRQVRRTFGSPYVDNRQSDISDRDSVA